MHLSVHGHFRGQRIAIALTLWKKEERFDAEQSSRKARSVPSASHRRPCGSLNTDSWPDMRKVFPAHPHSAVAHDFPFTAGEYTTAV